MTTATTTAPPTAADPAADLAAREQALRAQEATFAERQRTFRHGQYDAFIARLVATGRPLPVARERLTRLLEAVDQGAAAPVAFAEGEAARPASDELMAVLEACLAKVPPEVTVGERAGGSADAGAEAEYKRIANLAGGKR